MTFTDGDAVALPRRGDQELDEMRSWLTSQLAIFPMKSQKALSMLTTDTAVMLANYSDWADQVLFKAIEGLPQRAVHQPRQTLFVSMIGTLNHNYQVDLIWRAHLLGEKHGYSTRRDLLHPEFADLVEAQSTVNQWYIDWARSQTVESLSERLTFNFISGNTGQMTRSAMFLHVVNHKTYHRGWVSEMFFDSGMNPPETDLCIFLCDD